MKRFLFGTLAGCLLLPLALAAPDPRQPAADLPILAKDNNAFAFDLYAKLRAKEGNLFLSPSSVSTALAMTYVGARGRTAEQMAKTLHFDLPPDRLHPAFAALVGHLNGEGVDPKQRGYQLSVANALWGQNGYPWLPAFLGTTKKYYGAGLREVDFIHATEQARKTINAWVEKETRDKIKELLKEGILTSNTKLVLTNAIYFKGDWAAPFDKKKTADGNFFVTANRPVKVPMMYQEGEYRVHRDPAYWALELPYKGKEVSMLVFLPEKPDGLADFEKKFNADFVAACVKQLQPAAGLEVYLPKFKMTSEFSLGPALSDLGMKDAFGAADFSGMDGTGGLSISAVVHKAFVEVNEQGTEAAAATAVILGDSARKPFRADHPFVFVIRDNRTGSILFIGRVTDPSKS